MQNDAALEPEVVLQPQRLNIPSSRELYQLGNDLNGKVGSMVINTQAELEAAVDIGKSIKKGQKQVKEKYEDRKKYAKEVHTLFCTLEKNEMDPFNQAEDTIKEKIGAYDRKQEQIRRAEEARILREAEEKARAEEAANRKKAEEDQIQLAVELEAAGNHEDAAVVMDTPIMVAPVATVIQSNVIPQKPKASGLSIPIRYTFEIVRPELIPCVWHKIDEQRIQKQVTATGTATRIPGIKIVEERNVRLRA